MTTAWRLALLFTAVILLCPPSVSAKPPKPGSRRAQRAAERHHDRAVKAMAARNFEVAVAELRSAHQLDPIPLLAFNVGRAYEGHARQLADDADARKSVRLYNGATRAFTSAVSWFEKYLASSGPLPAAEEARERIAAAKANMQDIGGEVERLRPPPPPKPKPRSKRRRKTKAAPPKPAPVSPPRYRAPPPRRAAGDVSLKSYEPPPDGYETAVGGELYAFLTPRSVGWVAAVHYRAEFTHEVGFMAGTSNYQGLTSLLLGGTYRYVFRPDGTFRPTVGLSLGYQSALGESELTDGRTTYRLCDGCALVIGLGGTRVDFTRWVGASVEALVGVGFGQFTTFVFGFLVGVHFEFGL